MRESGVQGPAVTRRVWMLSVCLLGAGWLTAPAQNAAAPAAGRDLTFFHVSDTHYGLCPIGDETVPKLVDKMNRLPGTAWPTNFGGVVGRPRGVIHTGDITNDGKKDPWAMFVRDYGLAGGDGRLAWPVYETFGNHDGGDKLPVRDGIRERNRTRPGLANVSSNGLHYSWDWDGVHFVMCGISPGTTCRPYDPQDSIGFLAEDLRRNVGDSGRPVFLMHHFGFDKSHSLNWWPAEWRTNYFALIGDYNIAGILHGHAHEPLIYQWNGIDVYHPPHFRQKGPKESGPVTHGFFVCRVTDDEFFVAERKWDDTWGMTARKKLRRPAVPAPAAAP